jgi:hypothetical protein
MNREELEKEIGRVKTAIEKTTSRKLKHDYGKYLRRLQGERYGKRAKLETK